MTFLRKLALTTALVAGLSAPVAAEDVKFGLLQDFTAVYTFVTGQYNQGQQDYLALANAEGLLGEGNSVTAIVRDTGNQPQRGIEAYNRAKEEGAVLFDFLSTPVSAAILLAGLVAVECRSEHKLMPTGSFSLASPIGAAMATMVLLIIGMAGAFGWLMAYLHVAQISLNWMQSVSDNPLVILLMINIVLLVLGTFMDMSPLIVITTPIFLPVATAFGVDPVHFGVILILNLGIGLCTPPVGAVLFVGCAVGRISIWQAMRTIWPFYGAAFATLMLVTYIPALSLWLPSVFR